MNLKSHQSESITGCYGYPAGHLLAGYYQTETEAAKAYDKACIVTKGKPKNLPESTYEVRRCKLTLA